MLLARFLIKLQEFVLIYFLLNMMRCVIVGTSTFEVPLVSRALFRFRTLLKVVRNYWLEVSVVMLVRTMIIVVIMLWVFMLRVFMLRVLMLRVFTVVMEDGNWFNLVFTLLIVVTVLVFVMVLLVPVDVGPVRVIRPRKFFRPSRNVFIMRNHIFEVF